MYLDDKHQEPAPAVATPLAEGLRVDRILLLADEIERPTLGLGFHMGNIETQTACGTVCCIVGHVHHMFGTTDIWEARKALGLGCLTAHTNLFVPPGWADDWATVAAKYPRERAVRVLRHLAATGIVDWDVPASPTA